MPKHTETKILPYDHEFLFNLVSDIETYSEFLPWCLACRIQEKNGNRIKAMMSVGYKMFNETFECLVTLDPIEKKISVVYLSGPLKYLENQWTFQSLEADKTQITFYLNYAFKSPILQKIASSFFDFAFGKIVTSFEERAAFLKNKEET